MKNYLLMLIAILAFQGQPAAIAEQSDPSQETGIKDAATATPILWKMTDENSTIWFLGTYHILPPELDWRSPPVKRAIADAESVFLEADVDSPEGQGLMLRAMLIEGFNKRGVSLFDMLDRDRAKKLREIAKSLSVSEKAIDAMRPWNAFITITAQFIINQGFDPASGVDANLAIEIKASGRPLQYFETAAEQIGFFANLSKETEIALLNTTIDDWDNASDDFETLFHAWRLGDEEKMDQLINESLRDSSPEVHDVLLVNRNKNWVQKLEQLMEVSGTILVAVGAGHLVGDQSVIAMLRAKGYSLERVTN